MKLRSVLPQAMRAMYLKFLWGIFGLSVVVAIGTVGYKHIGGAETDWLDAFYMTVITVTTVGYAEVVDLSESPIGRMFTVFILVTGLGSIWFMFSAFTALLLESDINKLWRRRKMENAAKRMQGHYILCGFGRVGNNVADELETTNRHYVAIDERLDELESHAERRPGFVFLHGDAADDDQLLKANIEHAAGLFAITGDDSRNLMITLTARQLAPNVRVVTRCNEARNTEKMRKAGADAVVSVNFTGGMRIASAMLRPHVVSFLDEMLRTEHKLRIEEVAIPAGFAARPMDKIKFERSGNYVLLAVRTGRDWEFNPPSSFVVEPGHTLIAMASPQGRTELEQAISDAVNA